MEYKYYIAYGSNLNLRQMRERCPGARPFGTSVIKDYRLMVKKGGSGAYLTIEPEENCSVPVAVWEVAPGDETALDVYEAFPRLYYKKEMILTVKTMDGASRDCAAFVYIMYEDFPLGVPSREYMDACAEGYRDFGFDTDILSEAYRYSGENAGKRG